MCARRIATALQITRTVNPPRGIAKAHLGPVTVGHRTHDRQPQSGTRTISVAASVEAFKYPCVLLRRDAETGIGNTQPGPARPGIARKVHASAGRHVTHRILHKVRQQRVQGTSVAGNSTPGASATIPRSIPLVSASTKWRAATPRTNPARSTGWNGRSASPGSLRASVSNCSTTRVARRSPAPRSASASARSPAPCARSASCACSVIAASQRRAQFMRGVGYERALCLKRRAQAYQQSVQRANQR